MSDEIKLCKCGCGLPVPNPKKDYIRFHAIRDPLIKEKRRQQFKDKHGVDNPSQLKEVKDKKAAAFQKKYNANSYFSSAGNREKIKQTMLERYGVENYFQTEECKDIVKQRWVEKGDETSLKIKDTNMRVGYQKVVQRLNGCFELLCTEEEYIGVKNHIYSFKCAKCGTIFQDSINNGLLPRCYICNPLIGEKGTSNIEGEFQSFISHLYPGARFRDRSAIAPLELDVYIPEKNLAFEVDGLYWHSENNGKRSGYHLNKTKLCEAAGIRLVHIFEDEWIKKRRIVQSRVRNILGCNQYKIHGRKCVIQPISKDTSIRFINKYHIQGAHKGSHHLGAFYRNRLVSVMTFGPLRKETGREDLCGEWELIRFCSIPNFSIRGVAGKLLSAFIKHQSPNVIHTYADRRWSDGGLYKALGFAFCSYSKPSYWYTSDYITRLHRFGFQKHTLNVKLKIFDPKQSEWVNMKNNGFDRVWDCGSYVYKLTIGE